MENSEKCPPPVEVVSLDLFVAFHYVQSSFVADCHFNSHVPDDAIMSMHDFITDSACMGQIHKSYAFPYRR